MKILLPIILILLSISTFGQQRGKLVKNQSVLAMTSQIDTLSLWMVIITNTQGCRSLIEFKYNDNNIDTVTLDFDEDQQMMIHGEFILQFRNATKCEKGTTEWLYIDNNLTLKSNPNENNWQFNPNPIYDCSFIPLRQGGFMRGGLRW